MNRDDTRLIVRLVNQPYRADANLLIDTKSIRTDSIVLSTNRVSLFPFTIEQGYSRFNSVFFEAIFSRACSINFLAGIVTWV
jgi:hypothetical protein